MKICYPFLIYAGDNSLEERRIRILKSHPWNWFYKE